MSAVAAGISAGVLAAYTIYQGEENRKRQSEADDKAGDEMKKIQADQDWQKKKKGINDKNAAIAALRLRGEPGNPNGNPIAGAAGVAGQPPMGILGGPGGPISTAAGVNDRLNSPLGL